MSRICSIDGCDKPPRTKAADWCAMHYHRWYRHGDPLLRRTIPHAEQCAVANCARSGTKRGWCEMHYERWRRTGVLGSPSSRFFNGDERCTVGGCEKRESAKGYCAGHYSTFVSGPARRARKAAATTVRFTNVQVASRIAFYGGRCWLCGADAAALDHVKPLAKGGAHMLSNLRPICHPCNGSKGSRWPFDASAFRPPVRSAA